MQLLEVQYELADLPFIVRCGSCTILCVNMKKAIAIRLERSTGIAVVAVYFLLRFATHNGFLT